MNNYDEAPSAFAEAMQANPPRLVVQFRWRGDGTEDFQWGVVGGMPILGLIGHVVRVQADLANEDWVPECDALALVIAYDPVSRSFAHYLHPDIPRTPLVGMLEMVKTMLVDSRMAQHHGAQKVEPPILGPDGRPMKP